MFSWFATHRPVSNTREAATWKIISAAFETPSKAVVVAVVTGRPVVVGHPVVVVAAVAAVVLL